MKNTATLLFLGSALLPSITFAEKDAQIAASWVTHGYCAYYFEKPGISTALTGTCATYCTNQPDYHGYSECDFSAYKDLDLPNGVDPSTIRHDEAGDVFVHSRCKCSNADVEAIANVFLDTVFEALSQLDEIICGVFMTAMVTIVEVGIDLIPGGAATTAAARAVQGVKTFAENGLDIAGSMGNWVGKACGIQDPNWPNSIFDVLLQAPDSYGTSIGCKQKNKADCRSVAPVPDKPKPKGPDEGVTKGPEPNTSAPPADPTANVGPPTSLDPSGSASLTATPTDNTNATPPVGPSATPSVDPSATITDSSITSSVDPSATISGTATTSLSSSTESCGAGTATQSGGTCEATTPCEVIVPDIGDDDDMLDGALDELANLTEMLRFRGIEGNRSPRKVHKLFVRAKSKDPKDKDRKVGNPCSANSDHANFRLRSDKFLSSGKNHEAAVWEWEKPNDLCNYEWRDGKTEMPGHSYHTEHVMEWQVVTDFFAKLQAKGGLNYDHPDPAHAGVKTDFCTYWINTWDLPEDQAFSVKNSPALTPWSHIAAAYPSISNFKDELIRLQGNINTPAKQNLFTDSNSLVFSETDLSKYAKERNLKNEKKLTDKDRNAVLLRMRYLLGVRQYLTSPKIITIFKDQKERMGAILDELDTSMQTHTRSVNLTITASAINIAPATPSVTPPTTVSALVSTTAVTYAPWQTQNLLKEWDDHMNDKWVAATVKHRKAFDTFVNDLDGLYCRSQPIEKDDKEFCSRLEKLQDADKKIAAFTRPW